jgi:hypothetical protein
VIMKATPVNLKPGKSKVNSYEFGHACSPITGASIE